MENYKQTYEKNLVDPTIQKSNWVFENYEHVREWTLKKPAGEMIYLINVQQSIKKHKKVQHWTNIYNAFEILWKQLQAHGCKKKFEDLWDGILDKHRQSVLSVYLIQQLGKELPETLFKKLEESSTRHLQSEGVDHSEFEEYYDLLLQNTERHPWEQVIFMPAASAGPALETAVYFEHDQNPYDPPPEFLQDDESAGGLPLFVEHNEIQSEVPGASDRPPAFRAGVHAASARPPSVRAGGGGEGAAGGQRACYLVREPLLLRYDELGNEIPNYVRRDDDFESMLRLLSGPTREHVHHLPAASARPAQSSAGGPAASARPPPVAAGGHFVRAPSPVQEDYYDEGW
jgi:hypothetical protein